MSEQNLPMRSWAEDDRPREKLLQKGIAALSTNELFAILLRSGKGGESALDLARKILSDYKNDLNLLARAGVLELMNQYQGVGIAKAASIVAAIEIGRRRPPELSSGTKTVRSSTDAYAAIAPLLKDLDHEEFWVIYLNGSNGIKGSECLFSGGMSSTVIDVRMIFRRGLEVKASAIIIAHNHPGGVLTPSEYDKAITEKIYEAGKIIDLKLYDHIIVGNSGYFSFLDENTWPLGTIQTDKKRKEK